MSGAYGSFARRLTTFSARVGSFGADVLEEGCWSMLSEIEG